MSRQKHVYYCFSCDSMLPKALLQHMAVGAPAIRDTRLGGFMYGVERSIHVHCVLLCVKFYCLRWDHRFSLFCSL